LQSVFGMKINNEVKHHSSLSVNQDKVVSKSKSKKYGKAD
jgi:hypothetical protein